MSDDDDKKESNKFAHFVNIVLLITSAILVSNYSETEATKDNLEYIWFYVWLTLILTIVYFGTTLIALFCGICTQATENTIGALFTMFFAVVIPLICVIIQLVYLYITIDDNDKIAKFKFINEDVNGYGYAIQIVFMFQMLCGFILTAVLGCLGLASPCIYCGTKDSPSSQPAFAGSHL